MIDPIYKWIKTEVIGFQRCGRCWHTIICCVNFTRFCFHFSPIVACVILQKYQKNSKERDHIKLHQSK